MRFLLTLILVALATPAAAQISAGPTGGRALVDDNGKLIGGLHDLPFGGYFLQVAISTAQGSGLGPLFFDLTNFDFEHSNARGSYQV